MKSWHLSQPGERGTQGGTVEGLGFLRALPSRRIPSVPLIGPGARLLTRMFCGPHSTAKCRVIASAWKEGRQA